MSSAGVVVELTASDFDNAQKLKSSDSTNKGIVIVKYYNPKCVHCVNSQPEYIKLADMLKSDASFKVAQLDCTKYQKNMDEVNQLATGFTIERFPTYVIYVNTLFLMVYQGSRDALSIIDELANIKTG